MARKPSDSGRKKPTIGLWLIGACGGVGSTVALGLAALRRGLIKPVGMVSELPEFDGFGLVDVDRLCIGGHEIRSATVVEGVKESHALANLFAEDVIAGATSELRAVQREIRPGTLCGAGKTIRDLSDRSDLIRDRSPAAAIERLAADIDSFRRRKRLQHVVVINVASSEPPIARNAAHQSYAKLSPQLAKKGSAILPCTAVYSLAALQAGCPFVNFTPSPALTIPAVRERAEELGLPYMGNDGKTGESLVKSFLAPMFVLRNLSVLSWVGQNYLGNRDGAVLDDPKTRASKIRSKDRLLSHLAGGRVKTNVSIEFVPSLVDWKLAWDFIHFEGFLNTKMSLQFTWHGSDSVLAAPLVLDLARFAIRELVVGAAGPMRHLACFFKDPIGVAENSYFEQWRMLVDHVSQPVKTGASSRS